MNTPEYHLKHVLLTWSGLQPTEYDGDTVLADMWNGQTGRNDYDPVGIKRLLNCLKADYIFGACQTAMQIQDQDLGANGTLTTVLKLYLHLQNCGRNAQFRPTGPSTLK